MDWWGGGQAMAQVFPGVCGSLHPAKAAWGVLEYGKKDHTVHSSFIFKWHLIRLNNNFPLCLKTNKNQFPLLELSSSWQTPREVPLGPHCANQGVKG